MAEQQELRLHVDARAPGGRCRATSIRSPPTRAPDGARETGSSRRPARRRSSRTGSRRRPRPAGGHPPPTHRLRSGGRLTNREPPPGSRVARRRPEPVGVLPPSGSSRTPRPSRVGAEPAGHVSRLTGVPIYEYACMECEEHFDELVRSEGQVVTCPRAAPRGAPATLRVRRPRLVVEAELHAVSGGGCCGGGCGCGH